jgi:2-oxoisovalerate dehydrogenase E2 component (dihydrolipoyl transacylase)
VADIKDFRLPDLGEGLEEGEIVEWHVEVGDVIDLNQTVADVETAKAVVAVPSPFAGRVVERVGELGEALEVGTVFLRIDIDVDGGGAAAAAGDGAQPSPAQSGFEAGAADAADKAVEPDEDPGAVADERRPSTGLDADEEPQPLVGYGQGKAGTSRRRRRGGGTAPAERTSTAKPLAKPPVRKLAKDLGVDLAAIAPGSGAGGVITREDVTAAAEGDGDSAGVGSPSPAELAPQAAAPPPDLTAAGAGEKAVPGFRGRHPGEVEPIRGIRKRIVEKMETSRREIPEATCSRTADLTELWQLRRELTDQAREEGFDVKVTPFALVMRAAVLALRRFPTLNASIDRDAGEIRLLEHINLGFAADTDRGLMVPNIKHAHTKSTLQLAIELAELAGRARDGSVSPGDLTGGTFTVNNYGAFGNDDGDPIINHPEGAILGIGAIRKQPWVVEHADGSDEIAVRRVATFTLAFDHRICDGGEAGRFVTYVADLCEQPARILLHS